ncbi:MAG: rod shape-determining protein MreD [Pseudomonadales bacterium]|nr:rod shape-determining protein MreD [Pseudomonadales bacterium]
MRANSLWIIVLSFFVALVLQVLPMPDLLPMETGYLRPHWVALVLIYWIIALPHRIGLIIAWLLGLLMDVLLGSLLGQHAIALIIVAYIASSLYQRLRMFAVWQQSLIVFGIIGIDRLVNFWIQSIVGQSEWSSWYLLSPFVSALVWPWIFLVLRYMRRLFNVT